MASRSLLGGRLLAALQCDVYLYWSATPPGMAILRAYYFGFRQGTHISTSDLDDERNIAVSTSRASPPRRSVQPYRPSLVDDDACTRIAQALN